eukprot:GILI01030349.1.p1 GENE.GILI01030349.1~~GILI01030349.1.p1  ORF type:complete len:378 (-),score=82.13 GILI01030349.1:84-1217(-)
MPPKKHEVQVVVELPEQPPTLENNPALVDKLLSAALTHPNDVAATVAAALHMDDYLSNLQNGIVVDLWVELLITCAQNRLKANKAIALLEFVEHMRLSIVDTQGSEEAQRMLKTFFVRHAGLAVREKEATAANAGTDQLGGEGLGDQNKGVTVSGGIGGQSISTMNTAGAGSVGEGTKAKASSKKKGVDEAPPPPKPTFDAGLYYCDMDDMRAIAPFLAKGLLQHWRLYATVGANARTELFVPSSASEPPAFVFRIDVQTPIPSHSLSMALTLEEHTRQHADADAKAAAERIELQAKEEALIASEKASLEAIAAKRRAEEEEERLGHLYLKKATSARAVEQLNTSIEGELSERQRRIIQRIIKLEDALQLATNPSNI